MIKWKETITETGKIIIISDSNQYQIYQYDEDLWFNNLHYPPYYCFK